MNQNIKKKPTLKLILLIFVLILVSGTLSLFVTKECKTKYYVNRYENAPTPENLLNLTDCLMSTYSLDYIEYLDDVLNLPENCFYEHIQNSLDYTLDKNAYNLNYFKSLYIAQALYLCAYQNDTDTLKNVLTEYYPQIPFSYHTFVLKIAFSPTEKYGLYQQYKYPKTNFVYDNKGIFITKLEELYNNENDLGTKFEYCTVICAYYYSDYGQSQTQQQVYQHRWDTSLSLVAPDKEVEESCRQIFAKDIDMWNDILGNQGAVL